MKKDPSKKTIGASVVFERLYKGAIDLQQKKVEILENDWKDQQSRLFSPKITQMGKQVKQRGYFSPIRENENGNQIYNEN